jgi:hypothetical protein
MDFKYDIFISYGHLDDEDPGGDEKGWIDLLVKRLPIVIADFLGYKPNVWRDERSLHGNEQLEGAIQEGVLRSLVLVPIVSPRYVQSDWCRIELETFCQGTSLADSNERWFDTRIFKVIKSPLRYPHLIRKEPEVLRNMTGYPFFEMDGDMPDEFSPDVVQGKDHRYWVALRRLAQDISDKLVAMKQEAEVSKSANAGGGSITGYVSPSASSVTVTSKFTKYVYLAETTSDLTKERELVRDELRQRGFGVFPEQKLALEEVKCTEELVRAALERCALSVHLIGSRYGLTPEDDVRSIVRIQEEIAAQRSASDAAFLRLLWIPTSLNVNEIQDERQRSFVIQLQNRVTTSVELLQMSVEDLKSRVIEKLTPSRPDAVIWGHSKFKQVYLICEPRDRESVRPIKQYLFQENLEVITWLDMGAEEELMTYHRKNLKQCDAALIYFGSADEPWVRKNLEDLEKAYGYGREADWTASAVYVASPKSDQKEDFLTHMVPYVVRNFDSFNPNDLQDFVQAVRTAA